MSENLWQECPLSQVGTVVTGGTPDTQNTKYWGGNIPFATPADFSGSLRLNQTERYLTAEGARSVGSFPKDSVLVTCIGTIGKIKITNCESGANQQINAVICNKEFDPEFVANAISIRFNQLVALSGATTLPIVNGKSFASLKIACPTYAIQRRIAEILSTLDETIEQTEALIAKYQQIKAGLMHDLFTRGVTPDGKLRPTRTEAPQLYKESPLGWIPKEWEGFTVGELFSRRAERGKVGLPVMSITMSGGLVERDSVDRRVETNLSPEDHLLVRQGDIAYNMMRMWQGVLGRAQYDCLVSPAYIVLAPNSVIESLFGEYLLSTDTAIAQFKRLSYGVVDDRLRLYFRDIVRIRFAIPRDLDEQLAIANRLTTIDETILRTLGHVDKLRRQKLGLMHDLLTGRVRVKLAESEAA